MIDAVSKARPASIKGTYINTCTLSATMSPPVRRRTCVTSTRATLNYPTNEPFNRSLLYVL